MSSDIRVMWFCWYKLEDDDDRPGYCSIKRVKRKEDNERSYAHWVDEEGRLSSLMVSSSLPES